MNTITKFNLEAINPKNGEKYSPNLYAWLKSQDGWFRDNIVVAEEIKTGDLYIGFFHDGLFNGSRLSEVLCHGPKAKEWCYVHREFTTVEGFWEKYEAVGRCAIDTTHWQSFQGDADRYSYEEGNKVRACQWCGFRQRLHEWIEPVTRTKWVPYE